MSEPKWTPGSWRASQTYPLGDWCIHAPGIPWQLAYLKMHPKVDWPLEANARLIAAAPELYEALLQAETVMMIVQPRSHTREYLAALEKARAVLAKARGDDR